MPDPIEYGIRCQTKNGERWVMDDSGVIIRSMSVGSMQAQINHWLSTELVQYSDKTSNDRICAFGPDGEPVELSEVEAPDSQEKLHELQRQVAHWSRGYFLLVDEVKSREARYDAQQKEIAEAKELVIKINTELDSAISDDHHLEELHTKEIANLTTENAALKKQLEDANISEIRAMRDRADAMDIADWRKREVVRIGDENIELKRQLDERKNTEASDANDWRRMWDQLTRLTAANCKLLAREAPLMDCVRWYADPRHHAIDDGNDRAESCLRSLGLLDTDERSGEGC
jgi:hypothetical protein